MSLTGHRRHVFCSAAHARKLKNKSSAQLVCVNTLLIAEATHTHFSMDQHDILYNAVWFDRAAAPNSLALWASTVALCCRVRMHLLNIFPSVGIWISVSHCLPCLCCLCVFVPLLFFPLSALSPPSPRISQALWLLAAPALSLFLFLSPSSSSISHLLSGVSVSARQGRPWSDLAGNELLITSQETRHSTPTHPTPPPFPPPPPPPPPPPHHTPKGGKKKKKKLHNYRMLSPQREIVLERQGSRAEVQMKSV